MPCGLQENHRLQEQYEEIQAHMLSRSVAEGRSLLQAGDASIADEMHDLPRDEVCAILSVLTSNIHA